MTAKRDILEKLHVKLAETLLKEMDGEFASPALYNAASKFLSDNNVFAPMDTSESLQKLKDKIQDRKNTAKVVNLALVPASKEEKQDALDKTRTG